MARIEKIRITGVKYDGFQKTIPDILFDFNDLLEPAHTVITLLNSGGKGVLQQLIMQVINPLTAWKNNRVEAFFYNRQKHFRPYTFHVLVQFRRDTTKLQHVTLGICITAIKKSSVYDEELSDKGSNVDLSCRMYLFESDSQSLNQIENLPVKDESGQPTSFDTFVRFLEENQMIFQSYSIRQRADYHKALHTYGIEKGEFDILRIVNEDEAGTDGYFKGATSNFGLFHHKIIPEINKHLKQSDHKDDLLELFLDTAKIAQNLPVLIQRESAFLQLLEAVNPLLDQVSEGVSLIKEKDSHLQLGRGMYATLSEDKTRTKNQLDAQNDALDGLNKGLSEIKWRESNLRYAKNCQEITIKKQALKSHVEVYETLVNTRDECQQQIHEFRIGIEMADWVGTETELNQKYTEKDAILASMKRDDLSQNKNLAVLQVQEEWKRFYEQLENAVIAYASYLQFLKEGGSSLSERREMVDGEYIQQRANLNTITKQIDQFQDENTTLEKEYGRDARFAKSAAENAFQQASVRIQHLSQETEANAKEQKLLYESIGEQRAELAQGRLALETLRLEHKKVQDEEQNALSEISKCLREENGIYSHSWLIEVLAKLRLEQEKTRQEIAREEKELWGFQLDQSIANEDYRVPNADIIKLKESLSEQGIPAILGSEFLSAEFSEAEALEEIKKYPLLPFSLIVNNKDWNNLQVEPIRDMTLRSPVPIYVRESMQKMATKLPIANVFEYEHGMYLLWDKGYDMFLDSKLWNQYQTELQKKIHFANHAIKEWTIRNQSVSKCIQIAEMMLSKEESVSLYQKVEEKIKENDELDQSIKNHGLRIESLQNQVKAMDSELSMKRKIVKVAERDIEIITKWLEDIVKYKEMVEKKGELQSLTDKLSNQLAELKVLSGENNQKEKEWQLVFAKFSLYEKPIVERYRNVINNAAFPVEPPFAESANDPPNFQSVEAFQNEALLRYESIIKSEESLSADLIIVDKDIEHAKSDLRKVEDRLAELGVLNPSERISVLEPKSLLQKKLHHENEYLQKITKEELDKKLELERMKTRIDMLAELADKLRENVNECGRLPEEWDELRITVEEKSVTEDRRNTEEKKRSISQEIQVNMNRIQNLQLQIEKLNIYDLSLGLAPRLDEFRVKEILSNPGQVADRWISSLKKIEEKIGEKRKQVKREIDKNKDMVISHPDWDTDLQLAASDFFDKFEVDDFDRSQGLLVAFKDSIRSNLMELESDKKQADEQRMLWVTRASLRVLTVTKSIKQMVQRMSVTNQVGIRFPLITLSKVKLPEIIEDVQGRLSDYYIRALNDLLAKEIPIEKQTKSGIQNLMDISKIVLAAYAGQYPELSVYNLPTTNSFLYEKPKSHHYRTWEVFHKGSVEEATGSGGQIVAAELMVLMMIMTHRKSAQLDTWSVLISDNPFSKAVSEHIVDPIFAVANMLKFQWIVVTPPELVKSQLSKKFPVYWELGFNRIGSKNQLSEQLVHGGRIYHNLGHDQL